MANGGYISCEICTYSRFSPDMCDIFGIQTGSGILCRAFRRPKQSHIEARRAYPILNDLLPGTVYGIDNSSVLAGNPRPIAKIKFLK